MTLQHVMGQILEHVDIDRWERPAQLLRLVATLQEGPNPVPLGRQLLQAAGRTERQAKYDHDVLVRLAERDRVLMRWRGEGRRPDSWALTSIEKWRHVPWITPRRDVLRAFLSPVPDEAVALWAKRAAQAVELGTDTPLLDALCQAGLSVNLRSTTPRDRSTTPRLPGETGLRLGHNATGSADPVHAYREVSHYVRDLSLTTEREGEPEGAEQAGERFRQALAAKMKAPIFGSLRAEVVAFGSRYAERIDELLALVPTIPGDTKLIVGALPYLAQAMEGRPDVAPQRPDCPDCGGSGWIAREVAYEGGTTVESVPCDHSQGADAPSA